MKPFSTHLSDEEIADICRPYKRNFERVKFLQGLGLRVECRKDGSPLVWRSEWERLGQTGKPTTGPQWSRAA